jgi:indolepyruvate ferredoxin oxidoreductase beta subunit
VEAPMTSEGKCDILIALEPSEGLRNIQYLNKNSSVVLNIRQIIPATVSMGKSTYPALEEIKKRLLAVTPDVITVDAVELAEKAGNRQATNVVMMGTLFGGGKMPISLELIKEVIKERVPAKAVEANLKAFDLGYQACLRASCK